LKAEYLIIAVGDPEYIHIAVATGNPFENKVFTLRSCCWGPLQKQSRH